MILQENLRGNTGYILFKRVIAVIWMSVLLTTILGCGPVKMYKGPQLDKSQVAIIRSRGASKPFDILSLSVDGKNANRPMFSVSEAVVLPGKHIVELCWRAPSLDATASFEVTAEAGKTYVAKTLRKEPYRIEFWIEDLQTGEKVVTPARSTITRTIIHVR